MCSTNDGVCEDCGSELFCGACGTCSDCLSELQDAVMLGVHNDAVERVVGEMESLAWLSGAQREELQGVIRALKKETYDGSR